MWPVLFHIGSYPVSSFGFIGIIGLAITLWIQRREGERLGYDPAKVDELILASILCAWAGSRGTYMLQNVTSTGGIRDAIFNTGGFVMYGGVMAGVPCALWLARRAGISGPRLVDIITPGMTLGLGIGRFGCMGVGCDYGRPAGEAAWWTLTFTHPDSLVPPHLRNVPLWPAQPLMALALFVAFAVIYSLRKRLTPWPGAVLLCYMIVEPPLRFLVEWTRGDDDRGFLGPLSTSQAIAAGMFIVGIVGLPLLLRRPPTPSPAELAKSEN